MQKLSFLTVLVLFVQGQAYISPADVNMGTASTYAVIASETITNTGNSYLTGNLALYAGTSVTGFPPGTIKGRSNIDNAEALQAKNDVDAAATDCASRIPDQELNGDAGSMVLAPGVYLSTSSLFITGTLKLDCENSVTDPVWIFQITSTLITATGATVEYVNCLQTSDPKVYWNVGTSATIETTTTMVGTVMAYQMIAAKTGANTGALFARNDKVTMDTNEVVMPSAAVVHPTTDDELSTQSAGSSQSGTANSSGFKAGVSIACIVIFLVVVGFIYFIVMGREVPESVSGKFLTNTSPSKAPATPKTRFEMAPTVEDSQV